MLITPTMCLGELASAMGQIITEDEARAMRDMLVEQHSGEDTGNINNSDLLWMINRAIKAAYRAARLRNWRSQRHDDSRSGTPMEFRRDDPP